MRGSAGEMGGFSYSTSARTAISFFRSAESSRLHVASVDRQTGRWTDRQMDRWTVNWLRGRMRTLSSVSCQPTTQFQVVVAEEQQIKGRRWNNGPRSNLRRGCEVWDRSEEDGGAPGDPAL